MNRMLWLSIAMISFITPLVEAATLEGKVYDAATASGRGIPGASVDVSYEKQSWSASTDKDGKYTVPGLPKGVTVHAVYHASGYQVDPTPVDKSLEGDSNRQDVPMAHTQDNVEYFEELGRTVYRAQQANSQDVPLLSGLVRRLPEDKRKLVELELVRLRGNRR